MMVAGQLKVCTRCRDPIGPADIAYKHSGHDYCDDCAQILTLVDGVERDPKKFGGHQYVGPKVVIR
jgi:hypothetical protein